MREVLREGINRNLLAALVELNRKRSRKKEFSERLFEEEGISLKEVLGESIH